MSTDRPENYFICPRCGAVHDADPQSVTHHYSTLMGLSENVIITPKVESGDPGVAVAPPPQTPTDGYCLDCELLTHLIVGRLCEMCRGANLRQLSVDEIAALRVVAPPQGDKA